MQISKHVLSLKDRPAAFESPAGSIMRLGRDQLPILKGLSIRRLVLTAHAIRSLTGMRMPMNWATVSADRHW